MTKLHQLATLGQSIWYDNIRRALLDHGDLQALVEAGVTGVTSNPSIFQKAIAGSADYDEALDDLATPNRSVDEIYETLVVEDIQRAADILRPVYEQTAGVDGYVSLEVSPALAHDTKRTIAQARRLFDTLDRPNVMIKVPATPAGIPAIETLIGEGINVNVTLMFSLDHYDAVAGAYIAGLEKLAASVGDPSTGSVKHPERSERTGRGLSSVASVASFFVSRVDTATDRALEALGNQDLLGRIGIANAKVAYARFQATFSGQRWATLAAQGARVQRPLWASTGTKNPLYSDTLYVDALIGPDTVNTVPPATLSAFADHGIVAPTLGQGIAEAHEQLAQLAELGIDLSAITQRLQAEGVTSFADAFESLLASIAEKRERLLKAWQRRDASLGEYQAAVDAALEEMVADRIVPRIWAHDHTVWRPEPKEITNRLGWLHIADKMLEQRYRLKDLVESVLADGYTDVLLLGMGGSSLAPEVFSQVFGGRVAGMPKLAVLDSTDPGAVLAHAERLDPAKTLFIVATKSGGTVETLSFFKYFYTWTAQALGAEKAGRHFVAITDPGSKLQALAEEYGFRVTFLNDPNIGGRYSVLSYFGLVPAALVGVDVETLLEQSLTMACNCEPCNCPIDGDNNGAWLGAVLGELAKAGRDKVTFITSPPLTSFGDWVEQLIAESTGKDGGPTGVGGILPVVGEPVGAPDVYSDDRLFVYLRLDGDGTHDEAVQFLQDAGQPVVRLRLRDLYDLGEQFFLWEMATAVAGHRLGINPFDQPNVEAAKVLARQAVTAYRETGQLPEDEPAPLTKAALTAFLAQAQPGDPSTGSGRSYIALQAYVQPTAETDAALLALRTRIRDTRKLATTVGYGPRFLHSTGQLHKGDRGNGLFIQFTSDPLRDVGIPDEAGKPDSGMTFGLLKMAQALGDKQALEDAGRRVIRFHLGSDVASSLREVAEMVA
jgi:transaldolase/glucose-6-phosphate isomerase